MQINSALFNELILGKRDVPGFLIKEDAKSARCRSKIQWLMSNHNINRAWINIDTQLGNAPKWNAPNWPRAKLKHAELGPRQNATRQTGTRQTDARQRETRQTGMTPFDVAACTIWKEVDAVNRGCFAFRLPIILARKQLTASLPCPTPTSSLTMTKDSVVLLSIYAHTVNRVTCYWFQWHWCSFQWSRPEPQHCGHSLFPF